MVGDEADGEQHGQDDHQLQTPLLQQCVHVGVPGEDHHHVAVAGQDDEQGHDEPRDAPAQAVRQVLLDQAVLRGVVARLGGIARRFFKEHIWEDLDENQSPHHGADDHGVCGADLPHDPHGVDDAQVPVDADTREEADAAVQVEVEAESGHFTEGGSKSPFALLRVIVDQKGQRKNIQQVRYSEVQHKHVDVSHILPALVHTPETTDIENRPKDEDQDEHRG